MQHASMHLFALFLIITTQAAFTTATRKWPAGTYGVPRAKTGCPSSTGFSWSTGWRYQDTQDIFPSNGHSSNFHLDADVSKNNLKRSFCVKTHNTGASARPPWPKGKYCIYKKGTCPQGLKSGYITWDDEDWLNNNKKGGVLPDGVYDKNTKIFYCCRTDGNKNEPIELPTSKPFFLVAYQSAACQQVKWAVASTEWIRFDTEKDSDGYGGAYPYGAGLNDHTIHYCYYTSCNYTMTTSAGSFQSPSYPNPYPAGQYCSWKIKVPEGLQVLLNFPNFALQQGTNTDNVQLYDGQSETSPSLGVYSGDMFPPPSGVRSSSNVLFVVFKSDSTKSFTGFQATYTAQAPTQPPTTIRTTTTPPRTTVKNTVQTEITTRPVTTETPTNSKATTNVIKTTSSSKETTIKTTAQTSAHTGGITTSTATKETTTATTTENNSIPSTPEVTSRSSKRPIEETTASLGPEKQSTTTKEPAHTKPSTSLPGQNGSLYSQSKMERASSHTAVILVPLLCAVLLVVCLLMFFYYRRNRRRMEEQQKQSVYYESNPALDSMENPLYESDVKIIACDSMETDPVYDGVDNTMENPLYETKAQITDVYITVPTSTNWPVMALESNEDMDCVNPLYEATQSPGESSA